MKKIRKCRDCGAYTLKERHCASLAQSAHPARFNPNDKYARQRRKAKGIE
ncbi:MAG: nucleolar RNA-binding Nop10p family protein [Candidatus Micrarchaeia archaeon]